MAYNGDGYGGSGGYPYDNTFVPNAGDEGFEQQPSHGSMTVWAGSYNDQPGIDDPQLVFDPAETENLQQYTEDFIRDQQKYCIYNKVPATDAKKARKDRKKEIKATLKETNKNLPKQSRDGKSKGSKSGHAGPA